MDELILVTIVSAVAGIVGTGLGGILSSLLNCKNCGVLAFLMQFAGGIMIGVVCFDLLPHAFGSSDVLTVLVGIICGVLLAFIIDLFMEGSKAIGLVKTGIMSAIAIAAHNFFEGLAIGSGFAVPGTIGISLALVIMIHDIPEGIAMAAPMIGGGVKTGKAVLITALSGVPTAFGGFAGLLLGELGSDTIAFCLSIAGGTMITISFCDLLPSAYKISKNKLTYIGAIMGMIAGIIIVNLDIGG